MRKMSEPGASSRPARLHPERPMETSRPVLPQPAPEPPPIKKPEDRPFTGRIALHVDARDVRRGIVQVRAEIIFENRDGETLLYPEWLPGFHSPKAAIESLAGLRFAVQGKSVSWRRDPVDVYAFHVDVPEGASELEIEFQYLAPTDSTQHRVTVTDKILELQWNTVVLHPAGYFARNVQIEPAARFPSGWQYACVLRTREMEGWVNFESTVLDVLVDSPAYAGLHSSKIDLAENVALNVFADRADLVEPRDEHIDCARRLVEQATTMFGAVHYDRYDFLLALSKEIGANGVEHHRSCEISSSPDLFTEWDKNLTTRYVLAHEFVHSWNGKFRRGADSWQPCFHEPIRNSLMWVYEGLTEYYGQVLCARSGIWKSEDTINSFATMAGAQLNRRGRIWRAMQDTTTDPIIAGSNEEPWKSWQRSQDYYTDGALMWLDVDARIRSASDGKKSLDDFARLFFGMSDGEWATNTYDFGDVVDALHEVIPLDWEDYLHNELYTLRPTPPLQGFECAGYQLVFKDKPNSFFASKDKLGGFTDLTHSLGILVNSSGKVLECIWDSPSFAANVTVGSTLLAVNGRKFSTEFLKQAVIESSERPVVLAYRHGDRHSEERLDYARGLRYPHLLRCSDRPLFDAILAPLAPDKSAHLLK